MNPQTGEILAMVSYPTYENNRMARLIPSYYYDQLSKDPRHPLLNNAIQSEYPPGSVFKLLGRQRRAEREEWFRGPTRSSSRRASWSCVSNSHRMSPAVRTTRDHSLTGSSTRGRRASARSISLHCIAFSSNVCFYKLGGGFGDEIPNGGLGIFRLGEYARALGYGARSGIELPGEAGGLIPSPQWKRINQGENWSTGDTYIATVGQGYVLATPLQVLMSGATMANQGKLMQPTIVRQVTDSEGKPQTVWFNPAISPCGCRPGS